MEQYKLRGQTYSAWGKMQCSDKRPHAPHSWSSEVTVYGPYFCEGIHTTCPCVVKCGHPIDYHFVRSHENGLVAICLQCHIELTAERDKYRDTCERLIGHYVDACFHCVCDVDNHHGLHYNLARQVKAELEAEK